MIRLFWCIELLALGLLSLRAPVPPVLLLFFISLIIAVSTGGLSKPAADPRKKIRKQAKRINEITYKATINIPVTKNILIDKLLYIDKLYQKKKITKAETSFYSHILPKLIALQEKEMAFAEIPSTEGERAQSSFAPKMEEAYAAVETWCDNRIKAYSEKLELNSDIDKEVIVSLTKYL